MSWVGLAVWLSNASCSSWLLPKADMLDVPREVAVAEGYTVPVEASQVHVRDRATSEARTTWFRYHLPAEPVRDLYNELSDDPDVQRIEAFPVGWPDFADLGFEAPRWWTNEGTLFLQEIRKGTPAEPTGGRLWSIDETSGAICVWMWTWRGWVFRPNVTAPAPAP